MFISTSLYANLIKYIKTPIHDLFQSYTCNGLIDKMKGNKNVFYTRIIYQEMYLLERLEVIRLYEGSH